MPEIWRHKGPNYHIIVWQSTEPIVQLLDSARLDEADLAEYSSFRSETRKREWLTVRTALRHLGENHGKISYNRNGRPQLIGTNSISISHSGEYIAVMTGEQIPIGIDIEAIHPRIEKLAGKFVNDIEFSTIIPSEKTEMLHVIWGAKEVLFKIHSRGNVDFKNELFVEAFNFNKEGSCNAFIKKKGYEENFLVYYRRLNGFMLTWSLSNKK